MDMVRAHEGIIYKLVNLYAMDLEDRKDLVQEIMYQAWKGIGHFEGRSSFSTWLYRVSLNTILTQKRKQGNLRVEAGVDELSAIAPETASMSMEAKLLYRAIRALPETDRAIISLHLDGYSHSEIAGIIGLSEGNVRVKVHRIKKHLSDTFNQ